MKIQKQRLDFVLPLFSDEIFIMMWYNIAMKWDVNMTDSELIAKVNSSMYHQCRNRGYAAPVDVLMDIGILPKEKYEDWRHGRVPYLEAVCTVNLRKLSLIMHQMRVYGQLKNLKPSFCYYKQWAVKKQHGRKPVIPLRFSKSGDPNIEKWYATHWVDSSRIAELKLYAGKDEDGQEQ